VHGQNRARRDASFSETGGNQPEQPRVVVLDLSAVEMLDGGGLGMLVFLHRWTRDNAIQLKLVNPSTSCANAGPHPAVARFRYLVGGRCGRDLCTSHHASQDVSRHRGIAGFVRDCPKSIHEIMPGIRPGQVGLRVLKGF